MAFIPNRKYLADNGNDLFKARSTAEARAALDAEFWTNEFHQARASELNYDVNRARWLGLDVAWPISGDTIAAIRATA